MVLNCSKVFAAQALEDLEASAAFALKRVGFVGHPIIPTAPMIAAKAVRISVGQTLIVMKIVLLQKI